MLEGREIVIGVGGGIAAFKAAALASRLVQSGALVTAVMTASARRFVGPATFAALTGRSVPKGSFDPAHPLGPHIEIGRRAECLVVAPATADLLAKLAAGIADDLLTTLVLSIECPLVLAPAMNAAMWEKPAVQRNVRRIEEDGGHVVEPASGWLSCRAEGTGRMAEPERILESIGRLLAPS
jgi:phosphopantothenoylcysteine decarboxylase/phosphopantothenate--cysteine ligase